MGFTPNGNSDWLAVVRRVTSNCWWGRDVTPIAKAPLALNNETIDAVNAAGTGQTGIIMLNASNVTEFPNTNGNLFDGAVSITGALTVGGVPAPSLIHVAFAGFNASGGIPAVTQNVLPVRLNTQLAGVSLAFGTASSSGTLTVEHLTGTQAPGSGTVLLTAPISLSGAANTYLSGTLIATIPSPGLQFATGDRVGFVFAGTMTGLAGLTVTLAFMRY